MKLASKVLSEIKKINWSSTAKKYDYSDESLKFIKDNEDKLKSEFIKKHKIEKIQNDDKSLENGRRMKEKGKVLSILQGNLPDKEFEKDRKAYILDVIQYLAETDYYYSFEKEY